jgi:hypothetical protein
MPIRLTTSVLYRSTDTFVHAYGSQALVTRKVARGKAAGPLMAGSPAHERLLIDITHLNDKFRALICGLRIGRPTATQAGHSTAEFDSREAVNATDETMRLTMVVSQG